jgi:hypothetical protein
VDSNDNNENGIAVISDLIECDSERQGSGGHEAALMLAVSLQPAAEQRSELSPRRAFASLGSTPSKLLSPEGAIEMISNRWDSGFGLSIAPSGLDQLRDR